MTDKPGVTDALGFAVNEEFVGWYVFNFDPALFRVARDDDIVSELRQLLHAGHLIKNRLTFFFAVLQNFDLFIREQRLELQVIEVVILLTIDVVGFIPLDFDYAELL